MEDKYNGEKVLVIKNNVIFKDGLWQGIKTENLDHYYDLLKTNSEFILRKDAENSKVYQQIIPYILFKFEDRFFLYEYLENASESRLHHNYILGIAGHINPDDEGTDDIIKTGMTREWNEEVSFEGNIISKKLVGIINDDRREVEAVHLGLSYVFEGDSPNILIKEKDRMKGKLMTLDEMKPLIGNVNDLGWAPLIYPHLKNL